MKKAFVLLLAILIASLASCGYSRDDLVRARSEGYNEGYNDGYDDGYSALRPMTKPKNGTMLSGKVYTDSAITVTANSNYDYVVMLKDLIGTERLSFYVRAGDTVTIGVPAERLYVYFASGDEWYGYGKGFMFGENTMFTKDDEVCDFTEGTWTYTLHPVTNGNFSESSSSEDEFF